MHRRIWAPHDDSGGQADLLTRLCKRETGGGARPSAADALSHATLQQSWDIFSPEHSDAGTGIDVDLTNLLARRSAVTEVLFTPESLVLALTSSGLCAVFRRGAGRLCLLNVEPDERIESLFLSRSGGSTSIISVSLFVHDAQRQLRCRATSVEALAAGNPHSWRPLFASETLRFPGFVELCDRNDKCLTLCAESRAFKARLLPLLHLVACMAASLPAIAVEELRSAHVGTMCLPLFTQVWDLLAVGRPPIFEVPQEGEPSATRWL